MAKYGKKAQDKVKKAMHERKAGTLRSGKSGKKVTSRKQAIAIGLSEARRAGGKVPKKSAKKKATKTSSSRAGRKSAKKTTRKTTRKSSAKKTSTKKSSRKSTKRSPRKSTKSSK